MNRADRPSAIDLSVTADKLGGALGKLRDRAVNLEEQRAVFLSYLADYEEAEKAVREQLAEIGYTVDETLTKAARVTIELAKPLDSAARLTLLQGGQTKSESKKKA